MKTFEIMVDIPVKVEVQANSVDEAIEIIRQQMKLKPADPVTFTIPVEQAPLSESKERS